MVSLEIKNTEVNVNFLLLKHGLKTQTKLVFYTTLQVYVVVCLCAMAPSRGHK